MAKRAPADEPDYNPLGLSLVREVLDPGARKSSPRGEEPPPPRQTFLSAPEPGPEVSRPEVIPEPARGRDSSPAGHEKLSYSPPIRVLLPVGERVKLSHLLRSCLALLRHSEEHLLKRARKARGLVRPPNSEAIALSEFEDALTDLIGSALRETPFRKPGRPE